MKLIRLKKMRMSLFGALKGSRQTWLAFSAAKAAATTEAAPEVASSQKAATPEEALKRN